MQVQVGQDPSFGNLGLGLNILNLLEVLFYSASGYPLAVATRILRDSHVFLCLNIHAEVVGVSANMTQKSRDGMDGDSGFIPLITKEANASQQYSPREFRMPWLKPYILS
jgi:hypothetical protein